MEWKRLAVASCLAALFSASFPVFAQASRNLELAYTAMLETEQNLPIDADPGPPLKEAFAGHFGHVPVESLDGLSDADLGAYFSASYILAFYTKDPGDLAVVEAAFKAMEFRGLETPFEVKNLYNTYVAYRVFERARALAANYPDIAFEPLPAFRGLDGQIDGPAVLELHEDGTVARVPAGLPDRGPYIVVAAHPLCHFSSNAIREIRQNPEVATMFAGRTLWLMPQSGHMDIEDVRAWNLEFPEYAMRWAWRTSDWPMIKRWATPNFYFYLDGELVDTVIGWPPEGQRDALLAAFAKIGVVPEAADQRSR